MEKMRSIVMQMEAMMDIAWWRYCTDRLNGISLMMNNEWESPDGVFTSDSCLSGCRAIAECKFVNL